MRIVINGRFLNQPVTGVQRYARAVVDHLDQKVAEWGDLSFSLVCPTLDGPAPRFQNIDVIQKGRLRGHMWEQFELPSLVGTDELLCLGNTAPALQLLRGRKVVAVVHDLSYMSFPKAYSWKFRLVYGSLNPLIMRKASAVVTVSETAKEQILEQYPLSADRLFVIPNGGPPEAPPSLEGPPTQGPYVLYVGTLSKIKNVEAVIEVAQRLLTERPDLKVVFVGNRTGIYQSTSLIADQELAKRMLFVGQVNTFPELARYYRHAELLMFPSLSESSGLPPIEAMSLGCPVVASSIPALIERCGDAAVYCDPADVDDIHQKIANLLDDPALRVEMRARGLARSKLFTWQGCAEKLLAVATSVARQ